MDLLHVRIRIRIRLVCHPRPYKIGVPKKKGRYWGTVMLLENIEKFAGKLLYPSTGESWGRVAKEPDYAAFRIPILL